MHRVVLTYYYTAIQNNSGGYYIQNDEVDEIVVIEARNYAEATRKLDEITASHSSYCQCCGPRWGRLHEGERVPSVFGTGVIIYNYDGTITHTI